MKVFIISFVFFLKVLVSGKRRCFLMTKQSYKGKSRDAIAEITFGRNFGRMEKNREDF